MKTSQLTHIIRAIVAEEIKKQLPQALTEVFSTLGGKSVVTEQRTAPVSEPVSVEDEEQPVHTMKQSLRELFAGTPVMSPPQPAAPVKKTFTKNSVLNEVLNQTSPFSGLARQQMGGMSPAAAMAAEMAGVQIQNGSTPAPQEGQSSDHIPLSNVPHDVSALDLKNYAPPAVKNALSRNYSQMMKIIDKKRKGGT